MGTYFKAIDRFAAELTRSVVRWRWLVIVASVVIAALFGSNMTNLSFTNNYRVFFSDSNPELNAFLQFQDTYTKNDNVYYVIRPADGKVFSPETLSAVEEITESTRSANGICHADSVISSTADSVSGENTLPSAGLIT